MWNAAVRRHAIDREFICVLGLFFEKLKILVRIFFGHVAVESVVRSWMDESRSVLRVKKIRSITTPTAVNLKNINCVTYASVRYLIVHPCRKRATEGSEQI